LMTVGRREEAREALDEAIELAQHMPDPHREAQARAVLAALAARSGRDAEAREQLREALAIFQRLRARPYVRRVQRSLGGSRRGRDWTHSSTAPLDRAGPPAGSCR
jgi:tetratricopeptide (TPR) repeat protein